jgi:hypothetical protein
MIRWTVRRRTLRLPSLFASPVPFTLASTALFLMVSLALALPWAERPARPWRGYSVLLIRPESPARGRLAAFLGGGSAVASADATKVVSAYTAKVAFADFEGMAECTVADLPERLDPADPRQDSWLRGIGGYFHLAGGRWGWDAVYMPSDSSPLRRFLRCALFLGLPWRDDWRLADFDPPWKLLSILLAAAYAVLVSSAFGLRPRETGRLCSTAALPWLLWVVNGGLAELLFFYFGWLAWMRVAREIDVLSRNIHRHAWRDRDRTELRSLLRILAVTSGAVSAFFLAAGPTAGRILEMLRLASGGFAALCVPVLFHWRRKGERSTLFDPVTIVRRRPGRAFVLGIRGPSRLPLLALVLLTPLLSASLILLRRVDLPTPRPDATARTFSWEAMRALASAEDGSDPLPALPQFLLHRAYQEGLPFGRGRTFPQAGERVQILEYLSLEDSHQVVSRLRTVKVFDEQWIQRTLASAGPASLERMMLRQGRPVTVSRAKAPPVEPAELPFLAAVILVLLAAFLWDGELAPLLFARLRIFTVGGRA